MPAPHLIPPPDIVTSLTLRLDDLTPDLVDGVRVTLKIGWRSGDSHTIVSKVATGDLVGDLPDRAQSLVEAFLWGEAPGALLTWARALDGSAQSRRVRSGL